MSAADMIGSLWERVARPVGESLSTDVAGQLLRMRLSEGDRSRAETLSYKAQDGSLTEDERAELEAFVHAAAFLTALHSQARRALRSPAQVSGNGAPAA